MKKLILGYLLASIPFLNYAQNFEVSGDINTKGKIKINGIAGQAGQVLTSKGPNASPEWASLNTTTPTKSGGFRLKINRLSNQDGDFQVGPGSSSEQIATLELVEVHDFDTLVSISNNFTMTFNKEGVYHLEGQFQFLTIGEPELNVPFSLVKLFEKQTANSTVAPIIIQNDPLSLAISTNINRIYKRRNQWTYEGFFKAGATIQLKAGFTGVLQSNIVTTLQIDGTESYISGHLMSK